MCVHACRSVNIYKFCLIYMQSLHLGFGQLMQTSPVVGVKTRLNPTPMCSCKEMREWLFRGRLCLEHTGSLCAWRSQMKSFSFQQTHHNKQTQAPSLRHSQIVLYICLALQNPTHSHSHIGATLLFFTGNFHRILNSEINFYF